MAKISPVSIKYMIHANFRVEGALEKSDIIGAIFGQTEGLLGADLEMRDLQKEGKIGRIEVELERKNRITLGEIRIPTALDQSETTLIAAAVETIEKIGPCDAQVEVERIEDVRGSKRDYIIERAKKLMADFGSRTDSREISKTVKESARTADVKEYGKEKLPCGDISEKEIVVVEGRADVLNLLRTGVKNVISMNGTKLPDSIKDLSEEKEITLFVDGDRGGKLIIQNVLDNAKIKNICVAPDGKEVEELSGKEVLQTLRKKMPVDEFLERSKYEKKRNGYKRETRARTAKSSGSPTSINEETKSKIKEIAEKNKGKGKALFLNNNLEEVKRISIRAITITLKKLSEKPFIIIIDGTATKTAISVAEESGVKAIAARNFTSTNTKIDLIGF